MCSELNFTVTHIIPVAEVEKIFNFCRKQGWEPYATTVAPYLEEFEGYGGLPAVQAIDHERSRGYVSSFMVYVLWSEDHRTCLILEEDGWDNDNEEVKYSQRIIKLE